MRILIIAALALVGCVSNEMKPYVGRPIEDVLMKHGAPEQIIELPDGLRAYQFREGGGAVAAPAGSMVVASELKGCLLTYIATKRDAGYVVTEIRPPSALSC